MCCVQNTPVVVDVADDDGQQAEKKHHRRGINDWVEGLNARREQLHAAQVLNRRHKVNC